MKPFLTSLVALTLVTTAFPSPTFSSAPMRKFGTAMISSDEISSQRNSEHRRVRSPRAPAYSNAPKNYRRFPDPSFGPDGKPYRVPEYLRNQCYVDEGYGRFSACSNI